jgi:hypothetical protein
VRAIIHLLPVALDHVQLAAASLELLVQQALAQVDRVVQVGIAQAVLAANVRGDLAEQGVQAEIVPVVSVDLVQQEPVVVSVDLVQQEPVGVLLVPALQVELLVEHLAADQVDVRTQLAVVATQLAHSENQAADLLRVASQSALSVKSSTT